jgi:hypothetical protein
MLTRPSAAGLDGLEARPRASSPSVRAISRMHAMYVHMYAYGVHQALGTYYIAVRYGAAAVSRSAFAPYLAVISG